MVTLGFACFEFAQGRYFHVANLSQGWNPNDLPPLAKQEKKRQSLAHRVADLVVNALVFLWFLAVPYRPYLLLGPEVGYLHGLPFGLTPEWHIFYWQIVALMAVQLVLKTAILFVDGASPWCKGVDIVVQAVGALAIGVMVQARSYFVPAANSSRMSLQNLASLNCVAQSGIQTGAGDLCGEAAVGCVAVDCQLKPAAEEPRRRSLGSLKLRVGALENIGGGFESLLLGGVEV